MKLCCRMCYFECKKYEEAYTMFKNLGLKKKDEDNIKYCKECVETILSDTKVKTKLDKKAIDNEKELLKVHEPSSDVDMSKQDKEGPVEDKPISDADMSSSVVALSCAVELSPEQCSLITEPYVSQNS